MNTRLILIISIIFLINGCKNNELNEKTIGGEKSVEELIEQAEKKNDISVFFEDSINGGRIIKESFLTFEFGDSKDKVNNKIRSLIKGKKITRKKIPEFVQKLGVKAEFYIYSMKFENSKLDILFDLEYCENQLYLIRLTGYNESGYPPTISHWEKNKIIEMYKDKYKSKWFTNRYIPIGSTYDCEEYENLEGTRYISLRFLGNTLDITYKDIKLEKMKEEMNLSKTKEDI